MAALYAAAPASNLTAQTVSLSWNPSTSTNAAGYALYYGNASGVYGTRLVEGTNTAATIAGLTGGLTYFFVVSAYDAQGAESAPSNEASFTVVDTNFSPAVQTMVVTGGTIILGWNAAVGQTYQLQYKTDLNQTNWNNLGTVITASNVLASTSDKIGPDNQRFYRVLPIP